jgi:hypothetical protein
MRRWGELRRGGKYPTYGCQELQYQFHEMGARNGVVSIRLYLLENATASAFPVVRRRRTGLASELQ